MDTNRAIVLVPGLMPATSAWNVFERQLRRRGVEHVAVVRDLRWTDPVHDLTEHLSRHVDVIRAVSGVSQVDFVGHNFGGILARYYAQMLDLDDVTGMVATVGTPHRGTSTPVNAGSLSAQLQPDAPLVAALHRVAAPAGVRWLNYASPDALLVRPAALGVLHGEGLEAENVIVTGQGDLSLHIPRPVRDSLLHRLFGGTHDDDPLVQPSEDARRAASFGRHPSNQARQSR